MKQDKIRLYLNQKNMRFCIFTILFLLVSPIFGQSIPETKTIPVNPYAEKPLKSNQFLYLEAEQITFSFSEFEALFHKKSIDLLEESKLFWGIEYAVHYKKLFYSVQFSLGRKTNALSDSVDTRTNYNRFGLAGGYYLINSKRIQILSKLELHYYSIGLKNFASSSDIPLEDYIQNPNIDVTFSQFTTNLGLEINWKIPNLSTHPRQPFLIGISAGYNFDLGKTNLQSENNTLKTSKGINIEPLSLGIHFTAYL